MSNLLPLSREHFLDLLRLARPRRVVQHGGGDDERRPGHEREPALGLRAGVPASEKAQLGDQGHGDDGHGGGEALDDVVGVLHDRGDEETAEGLIDGRRGKKARENHSNFKKPD